MKRKLLGIVVILAFGIGYCQPRYCYVGRCQLDQKQATVVIVNGHPRVIVGK